MLLPQAGPRGRRIVAVVAVLFGVYLSAYHLFRASSASSLAEHKQGFAVGLVLIVAGALLWRSRKAD